MQKITHSPLETIGLGEWFSQNLRGGEVVALFGELGSGKTTFVHGIAQGLGIKKRILSPTFIIVRHYSIIGKKVKKTLYHIDLYRIKTSKEVADLGLKDLFTNKSNIIIIEWPERLGKFLPKERIDIHFKYIADNKREITIWNF